jgi:NhaP-type Na+/H+ or K+/H+ antiporter
MEILTSYNLIIELTLIIIVSFLFDKISKKTNIPSVLMLIALGVILQFVITFFGASLPDVFPVLEILGIVGLIMIVLEAALDLELKKEKIIPILKSFTIALISLVGSTYIAALILHSLVPEISMATAWLYATPLSVLSSAVIIPSVAGLPEHKKEFHIYEGTFSDILGIMMFYLIIEMLNPINEGAVINFSISLVLTIVFSLIASYIIILVFQKIERKVKLFLLIAVLLLLYALGKKLHVSSLIIILVFGLVIANMKLFFKGPLAKQLNYEKAHDVFHQLHMITGETAFVIRTLFFVVFGLSIVVTSLFNVKVALISILILISIYLIRWIVLRIFLGKDILPQLFIAPRGLITVLLFYAIPKEFQIESFEPGILLFIIIGTSIIMTFALIKDKRKTELTAKVELDAVVTSESLSDQGDVQEVVSKEEMEDLDSTNDLSDTSASDEDEPNPLI